MNKLAYLILFLLSIGYGVKSQTKDTLANKICIEKIKALYGNDVDYQGPVSIQEIEKEHTISIEKDGQIVRLPFGFLNDNWKEIKSKMKKGDKIFKFTTSPVSWANLAGREGVIVLRGNVLVGQLITTMN